MMRAIWLAKLLLPRMTRLAESRDPDFQVVRDEDREVYLRRWWVIPRNNYFNIYLHHMIKDDDPILHDHMYWSISLMIGEGRLLEKYVRDPRYVRDTVGADRVLVELTAEERDVQQGHVVLRSAKMAHQLIVVEPTWTIFVTGPRIKEWGFWCPRGWRHWRSYVALSQDPSGKTAGQSGRGLGCGEMS